MAALVKILLILFFRQDNPFTCFMPRLHINRAPYEYPYPAACRWFRDRTGTFGFSFIRHLRSHILLGVSNENTRHPQGCRLGVGRMPAGNLTGSVRRTGAPNGSRGPAGVLKVRCDALSYLSSDIRASINIFRNNRERPVGHRPEPTRALLGLSKLVNIYFFFIDYISNENTKKKEIRRKKSNEQMKWKSNLEHFVLHKIWKMGVT